MGANLLAGEDGRSFCSLATDTVERVDGRRDRECPLRGMFFEPSLAALQGAQDLQRETPS
jgi:hypothetical protein